MVLRDYYKNLPERSAPKQELLSTLAERCGVSVTTARNWCVYGMRPRKYSDIKIICEVTGLNAEELWED